MSSPQDWPEPIVRVQSLSDSGLSAIPDRYVKPPAERPSFNSAPETETAVNVDIPVIDLQGLNNGDQTRRTAILNQIFQACTQWGFFQVINHGVSPQLMDRAREVWYGFFHQPMEVKQSYANSPKTYEGYGSRLGIQKGAVLDWGDYYFLHCLPSSLKDHNKWPAVPGDLR
jgi:isopenicillin N synthase-like dioxygenase